MIKLLVVFSSDAHACFADANYKVSALEKNKELTKGYDWDIKEFATETEAVAYRRGLTDGNGWLQEVHDQILD